MILIGYVIQIKYKLDLSTLAKINIYFLAPGFIFNAMYHAAFSGAFFFRIIFFFLIFVAVIFLISRLIGKALRLSSGQKVLFTNSTIFFNSGNYGVPVNALVFQGDPLATSIQVVVLTFQNIFLFSYGIFSLKVATTGKWRALLSYFRMAVLYGCGIGLFFNQFKFSFRALDVRQCVCIVT